jgi:hypothetical protein
VIIDTGFIAPAKSSLSGVTLQDDDVAGNIVRYGAETGVDAKKIFLGRVVV